MPRKKQAESRAKYYSRLKLMKCVSISVTMKKQPNWKYNMHSILVAVTLQLYSAV
jgi:hypothetical protein